MQLVPKTLENDWLRLEPLQEHHRETMRPLADDPATWEWTTLRGDGDHFDTWFDLMLSEQEVGRQISHAIYRKEDGELVGHSAYLVISPRNKRAEIGWTWYTKEARGTKVNPAAKLALLSNLFESGAERAELKTHGKNLHSQAAMRKMGAQYEGTFRRHTLTWKGDLRDTVWFSVLKEDWPGVRRGLLARLS
ncbi:GNAT family protein [Hyphobacterium sp. HN65]|uniref:GNAT family protein n=1 Tax=Hyphobacterium lacteum TaxID=3116575 RepID=A0ABU7LP05_9PROT|nr:GNAT family protein [Hyphobacterium sp. HN65]MEE2525361.1 GNAT family protein [Hyphobacterium sp. HN65]